MPNILSEIQLWKADRSAQISLPDGNGIHNYMESDAEVKRLLGDVDTLTLTLTPGSKLATATSDDAYELTQGKIVRFVYDDGSIEEWRIKSKSREFSGEKNPKVRCEPIVQDLKTYTVRKTLANGHARASVSFYNQSFTDIITNLLSSEYNCPDLFTVGSIASGLNDQTYNLVLNASYIMEGLKKICQLAEAEWGVSYNANNDNYEINFYESGGLGGGESEAADRPIAMGEERVTVLRLKSAMKPKSIFRASYR
ncbi:hypothetical protein [Fodinibius sp.]|uniref:hypothetical protein n=1 Tax=Fodinibius sp. TaxID=1872440 RepID=UPI002ACD5E53|nr:hypothetical protein [Fodinibius sp.]MDZ7658094.1 hypothetical protein [Fodinibius sp.]